MINNIKKAFIIVVVYFILTAFLAMPYVNLIKIYFSFIPILAAWITFILLFKIKKKFILYIALTLFLAAIPFGLFHNDVILEEIGNLAYLVLVTYLILSLRTIKKLS